MLSVTREDTLGEYYVLWNSCSFFPLMNLEVSPYLNEDYLFMAALGLIAQAGFPSRGKQALLFLVMHGFSLCWPLFLRAGL